jgi:hypothetical protein
MPNYQNSKIYKIISPANPDLVYYGATTQSLSVRMAGHRRITKTASTYRESSKEILCFDDAIIILVENYPCNSKEELYKKESEYILNNVCVNKRLSCRTRKEYYKDNKEQIKEQHKKYYELNKDKLKEYQKEQIKKYIEDNKDNKDKVKEQKKKYYEGNKDKVKEQRKKYYEINKDKLKEYQKKYRENKKKISNITI